MNLSQLIKSHKGARSYADLSRDCGGYPSDKRIQQLATQAPKNFIDPPTVVALAKGLRVPQVAVVLAVAESLNLDVRRATPALLDRLPPGIERLSETQINAIAEMIRALLEASEGRSIPQQMREVVGHLKWIGPDGVALEGRELSESLDWLVEQMLDGTREQVAALAKQFQMLTHPGAEAVFAQLGITVEDIDNAGAYQSGREGGDDGTQASTQKSDLERARELKQERSREKVSESDDTVEPAALDAIEGVDEEPGGSEPDES
jgi:hypothetical protein